MKSNREFLDGMYSKAEVLEKQRIKPYKAPRFNYNFAALAAMIILIPTIFFWKGNTGYQDITSPMMIRNIEDSSSYFQEADFVLTGITEKIDESIYMKEDNYIYTDINFKIEEALKGEIDSKDIIIRVNGGMVKKEKLKSKIEGKFIKGESSLVFLSKDEQGIYYLISPESQFEQIKEDLFKDKSGNEYSLEKLKNN